MMSHHPLFCTLPTAPQALKALGWCRWSLVPAIALAIATAAQAQPPSPEVTAPSYEVAHVQTAAEPAIAIAPAAPPPLPQNPPAAAPRARQIDIGGATQALWALQRASPGTHPRSIDGEQASRSYTRYLKSFETSIPEYFNTGTDSSK